MALELLFSFFYTEDPDSLLCKPFDHERGFIIPAPQAVKHKYQKNIKPFVHGIIAKFLNCIPIFCCHLETRYAFLAQFFDDRPSLFFSKLAAFNTLHGNVIVIHLSFCRNTVQAFYSLHFTFTSYGLPHNISLTASNSYHQYQQQMRELFSTF